MSTTEAVAVHNDNMVNVIAGLGKQADKALATRPSAGLRLSDMELCEIWDFNGLGAKIVSTIPNDAISPKFTVPADTDNKLLRELERLKFLPMLNIHAQWARLFGGSVMVAGYADNQEPSKPRTSTPSEIQWFKVYGLPDVLMTGMELDPDPKSANFEKMTYYPIIPVSGITSNIHYTRCTEMRGDLVSNSRMTADSKRRYWGQSVIQRVWQRLAGLGGAMQGMDSLMLEFSIAVYKLAGLGQMVSSGQGDKVLNRMTLMNMGKSILRGLMLDATEDFSRVTTPMAGVSDILSKMQEMLAAEAEIPVTKLFGTQAKGLGGDDKGSTRQYDAKILHYQEVELTPVVLHWVKQVNAYLKVLPEDKIEIKWGHPNPPTERETADLRKVIADTDKIYAVDIGSLSSDEIRESRWGGGSYSPEITVDPGSSAPGPDTDPALNQGEVPAKAIPNKGAKA